MKTPVILLLAGFSASVSHGFSLDAAGYQGNEVAANPSVIFVPGYGEILLSNPNDVSVVLASSYRADFDAVNPPLLAANNAVLPVSFAEGTPESGAQNEPLIEAEQAVPPHEPKEHTVIPEPAAAGIGLLAGLLWLIKRRKQNG